ncbi:Fe-S cluster assembly protein SufD [Vibrio panuliri]|uniref:Fe-S cluster assembly protein SufD n=1 Tax=Vibrio panuliri TaxID=1381081 RepID=A0ABX3FV16_9VIBR|nr:Fe-S cluster assembly protein SufD [Vibrio panuliri]KAB1457338.1 Fe-S cluster assembly protein SufD [Vibrio panuliri]OLQ96303.1 Fe-S cluster assembly protein SufD [Vibrio panuliri]
MAGLPLMNDAHLNRSLAKMTQESTWQKAQWSRLAEVGLPDSSDEAWRYTPLSSFKQLPLRYAKFQPAENISYESLSLGLDSYRLVFFDGRFSFRCSDWIPHATITPLHCVTDVDSHELRKAIKPDAFVYLTDATASGGVLIEVAANRVIDKPIYLLHINSGNKGDVCSYRHHVDLGTGAQCEIIEHHVSLEQGGGVTLSRLTGLVQNGARFYHTKLIEESGQQHHFGHNDTVLERDAFAQTTTMALSGRLVRHQNSSALRGENGYIEMNSLSLPHAQHTFDNRTYLSHAAAHCISKQLHKIIAKDEATGVFEGMIYVAPVAQQTDGQMDSHNLLLGESATVNTKPQLEIYADDVKCSHGATSGQLNRDQIDYMRARGIPKSLAESMLLKAFASEVAFKLRNPLVKEHVLARIDHLVRGDRDAK